MIRIVGETSKKTANTLILNTGQKANVLCGADILLSGIYQNVRGEAVCPVCGDKIQIVIEDRRVVSVDPAAALLRYVIDDPVIFSICCDGTIIFDKKKCLEMWRAPINGGKAKVSSLQEFMNQAVSCRRI